MEFVASVRMEKMKDEESGADKENTDERIQQLSGMLKETMLQVDNYKKELEEAEASDSSLKSLTSLYTSSLDKTSLIISARDSELVPEWPQSERASIFCYVNFFIME